MKINLRTLGALTAAVAIGASLLTGVSQANATPTAVETKANISTVFDINGVYSDYGSARPRITRSGNLFTIDMSTNGGRPTAHGTIIDSDTIMVSFRRPDETIYAELIAPRTIRWSNNSSWVKATAVPNVRGMDLSQAIEVLKNAGFGVGTITYRPDRICNYIGLVMSQSPHAGSPEAPGTRVNLTVGTRPSTLCP